MSKDLEQLATEAYVYGFPLVFNLDQVERFTTQGMGSMAAAPFNRFSHAGKLAGPDDTFVSINNDTIYSMAQMDVSDGPALLRVPDADGRYYVLQFVDAWTNNFAYVGRRATGTKAGTFLLTPPGWHGDVPAGATVISAPTTVFTIVGRWACDGPDDLPTVAALQAGLTIEASSAGRGLPAIPPGTERALTFYRRLRSYLKAFPPSAAEQDQQRRFAPLGLLDTEDPFTAPSTELHQALIAGFKAGQEKVETFTSNGGSPTQNGWKLTYHAFDYNLDNLGPGTLNDPRWIIQDRAAAHLVRAAAARAGLWGNHGYEAAYTMTWNDGSGQALDGHQAYTLRFDTPPPVDAFWSVTMYDLPDYYLVANPIDRYSIGDRTPGLRYADDGSLSLHLRPDAPTDPAARANWLPTPAGPFRPILRMYEPKPAVFDGSYTLPPITRTTP
ncbi:DUF1254 domain-containing protein [Streptacidiphilus jiangxiensis]|uniref:Uncharacterized conserved protein n=1 Tax=Streptacidiphilus jiangxiensis TaxID=235985 RepID=A0A1H7TV65_STRJI|nr:DUF1254 domain-containing protein [Streptacidiphilus jiangxiensis]SEL88543.1 Uncharacterized conserved protein [Streptacidiphilus jiangxiensis]